LRWREAFRRALAFMAFSIAWAAAGGIFLAFGLAAARERPTLALLFFILSYVVAGLGIFTALLKALSEAVAEEVKGRG
jgi:cytochrome c biogenesis protein CcdA